jgi:hypothetical protein
MNSQVNRIRFFGNSVWLFFLLFMLSFPGQLGANGSITGHQPSNVQWTPYPYPQRYPYPQPYPPGYYPPGPGTSEGTRHIRPSGWISIEIDPPDAAVFIDGHKLDPEKDKPYEEGVFIGRHKVEVKKSGYHDHMEWVDVQTGATQSLKVFLQKIK